MVETSNSKPARPWRVIAEEASREHDAAKMAELMHELNQALEEQGLLESSEEHSKKIA
jgi:hypothetical protein